MSGNASSMHVATPRRSPRGRQPASCISRSGDESWSREASAKPSRGKTRASSPSRLWLVDRSLAFTTRLSTARTAISARRPNCTFESPSIDLSQGRLLLAEGGMWASGYSGLFRSRTSCEHPRRPSDAYRPGPVEDTRPQGSTVELKRAASCSTASATLDAFNDIHIHRLIARQPSPYRRNTRS